MSYELKDFLNSINFSKKDLFKDDEEYCKKNYNSYVVNACLGMHYDTIMYANEVNTSPHTSNKVQYRYLLNNIRKKKRFGGRWLKPNLLKDLDYIKEYYGYSNEKAKTALNILSKEQIETIKKRLYKGGRK